MKLVYKKTGNEVKVGDEVLTTRGDQVTVKYFDKPHKPSSAGKVYVELENGMGMEYYVTVIGAEWIEREDR
jgi:hypothetical protein